MNHEEWRLRGVPALLRRRVRNKAGGDLERVLLGLLNAYADGKIDPLSESDPIAAARGALGGRARANALSPERRSEIAKHARAARTDRPVRKPPNLECEGCHLAPAITTVDGRQLCATCAEPPAPVEPLEEAKRP